MEDLDINKRRLERWEAQQKNARRLLQDIGGAANFKSRPEFLSGEEFADDEF